MTARQKRIILTLVITNVLVILALVLLVVHPPTTSPSLLPPAHPASLLEQDCRWQATQLLARAGLGGTVALAADDALRFGIAYPLAPGQMAEEAAQSVWTAFDVALALLQEEECAIFTRVEVTILAHDDGTGARISASVSAADLAAFGAGEVSEDAFIERVTYATRTTGQP